MMLHTYNLRPMSLPNINFLHLMVSEIKPRQVILGQGNYGKVKSTSHYDILQLHILANVSTKYQLPTPYGFRDLDWTDFIGQDHYGKVKGQIKVTPTHPNQRPYQVSASYTLEFPRYSPDKILYVKVTTAKSNVKSRSHHDVAHLHPLTNVPTKYQPFPRYSPDKIL